MERILYVTAYLTTHIALAGSVLFAILGETSLAGWTFIGFILAAYTLWHLPKPRIGRMS